jgi:hypothetical protein
MSTQECNECHRLLPYTSDWINVKWEAVDGHDDVIEGYGNFAYFCTVQCYALWGEGTLKEADTSEKKIFAPAQKAYEDQLAGVNSAVRQYRWMLVIIIVLNFTGLLLQAFS